MSYLKSSLLLFSVSFVVVGALFISTWLITVESISHADLVTASTITTGTCATLLGIITAGLMFTHGKFSELSSDITEKLPEYLTDILSLKRIQAIENGLVALRKTFVKLAAATTILKEKNLYERIVKGSSLISADLAVLSHLKLRQEGLDAGFLVSEMDSNLYNVFEKRRQKVKKEWHLFQIIREIVDTWEAPPSLFVEKSTGKTSLRADLRSSASVLKLKEDVDKHSKNIRNDVTKTLNKLNIEIGEIGQRLREDRVPQLLSQMEQASILRGKYFFLTLLFIAAPLLINVIILPQFSQGTTTFFKPFISITSLLSVIGVMFLFLYIHEILNV